MIKVVEWGTGEMGQGLLKFILDRPKDIELSRLHRHQPGQRGQDRRRAARPALRRQDDHRLREGAGHQARRRVHQHPVQPERGRAADRAGRQVGRRRHLHRREARLPVGQRPRARRPVRPRRQGERRLHPGHRHQPRLHARRPDRHVELDLHAHRQHRGLARQRPLAVRPHRHDRPGRGHHGRAVREGRRRRQHRRPHRLPRVDHADRQGAGLEDRPHRGDPRADRHQGRALHAARQGAGGLGRRLQAGRQGLHRRRAQDPPHPPAADPSRAGRPGHRRLHQDRRRPQREHGQHPRDPGRQGHLRQHRQLHPAHEGRAGRHADRGRHAAAAVLAPRREAPAGHEHETEDGRGPHD